MHIKTSGIRIVFDGDLNPTSYFFIQTFEQRLNQRHRCYLELRDNAPNKVG